VTVSTRAQDRTLGAEARIGVISPYQSQVRLLRAKIDELLKDMARSVEVNTIDGFQGREKDVIIFSTVRSRVGKKASSIGFVADERRINVGLTRARAALLVVGHRHALARNETWLSFVRTASNAGSAPPHVTATPSPHPSASPDLLASRTFQDAVRQHGAVQGLPAGHHGRQSEALRAEGAQAREGAALLRWGGGGHVRRQRGPGGGPRQARRQGRGRVQQARPHVTPQVTLPCTEQRERSALRA